MQLTCSTVINITLLIVNDYIMLYVLYVRLMYLVFLYIFHNKLFSL